ncbi:hypothetical protein BC938DRAFT_473191, partial [Jimgerdemannia flammicorona]
GKYDEAESLFQWGPVIKVKVWGPWAATAAFSGRIGLEIAGNVADGALANAKHLAAQMVWGNSAGGGLANEETPFSPRKTMSQMVGVELDHPDEAREPIWEYLEWAVERVQGPRFRTAVMCEAYVVKLSRAVLVLVVAKLVCLSGQPNLCKFEYITLTDTVFDPF